MPGGWPVHGWVKPVGGAGPTVDVAEDLGDARALHSPRRIAAAHGWPHITLGVALGRPPHGLPERAHRVRGRIPPSDPAQPAWWARFHNGRISHRMPELAHG